MDLVLLARIMCTLEGLLGVICNIFLLYSLLRLNSSSTDKVFRVPIYLCGIQGLWLGFWLAVMNYVNIFHDGNFIIPLFGLLVPFLPHWIPIIVEQVGLVFTASLFISIPANSTLQIFALSRQKAHWPPWKRLCLAFLLPLLLTIDVVIVVPSFVPSPELHRIMEETTRELYNVDDDFPLVIFGSSINNIEINYGRNLLVLVIFYVLIPYAVSYTVFTFLIILIRKRLHVSGVVLSKKTMQLQRSFFVMQLLQGFLPLAILSIPVGLFIAGAILQLHLDLFTLLLTYTLWFCPVVQALVQLRFVRRAAKREEESIKGIRQSRASGTRQTWATHN